MATDKPFRALDIIWGETSSEATPPTAQEDKPFRALDEIWGDEQPAEYTPPPSRTESALRGAAQGATFGFSDELAALPYLFPGGKTYREDLEENRAIHEAAKQANPGSYLAGEIGGAVGSTLIPGAGLARLGGVAGKAGSALQKGLQAPLLSWRGAGTGVGLGGLYGAGLSEADSIGEFAGDVGIGAGLGAAGSAGLGVLGASSKGIGKGLGALGGYIRGTPAHRQAVKTIREYGVTLPFGKQYPGLAPLEELISFSPASRVQKFNEELPEQIIKAVKERAEESGKILSDVELKNLTDSVDLVLDQGDTFVNTALKKASDKTSLPIGLLRGAGVLGAGSQIGLLPTAGAIGLPWAHRGVSSLQIPMLTGAARETIDPYIRPLAVQLPRLTGAARETIRNNPYIGPLAAQLPNALRFNIPAIGLQ